VVSTLSATLQPAGINASHRFISSLSAALPPHLTHVLRTVDAAWARSFKALLTRLLRGYAEEAMPMQVFWALGLNPAVAGEARRDRVKIGGSAMEAARVATGCRFAARVSKQQASSLSIL
jgi:hypothetical protein